MISVTYMNFILTEHEKKFTTSFLLWGIQKIFVNELMVILAYKL